MTAISTEDIEKQAFQTLDDVVTALPSVNLINALPGRNDIVMRGISTGSGEYYTDSQIAVYLDDQPMTSISQQVDVRLIDIERVEVLPGPQGTLFGSSSQVGTIRYITNKPNFAGFSSQVDLRSRNDQGRRGKLRRQRTCQYPAVRQLRDPRGRLLCRRRRLRRQCARARINPATKTNADVVEEDWNDYTASGGRIAARWQISPQWEASLSLVSQSSDADGAWDTDPAIGDYKLVSFFDEFRDDDWYQASASVKGDLGFAELIVDGVLLRPRHRVRMGQRRSMRTGVRAQYLAYGATTSCGYDTTITTARSSTTRNRIAGPTRCG